VSDQVAVKVDTAAVEAMLKTSPVSVYAGIRKFLFGALLGHRIYWLRSKGTKFGRASEGSRAVKVWRINEAPQGPPLPNWVTFTVRPDAKRIADPDQAIAGLQQLQAEVGTGSLVLEVHQKGGPTVSPTWMAIPIRTRPGTPEKWRQANPGKQLVVIPDRSGNDRLWLAERIRKMRRGRKPAKGSRRRQVFEQLRKRFLLTHRVFNKPTLKFYESWDQLIAARAKEWAQAADEILQGVANGNAS